MAGRTYRVKDVAELSGVTVRTLHHYDAIGLLCPAARTRSGYRLYGDDDLLRLQQILVYRELGLSLETIKQIFADPQFDRQAALLQQREQLTARVTHTEAMIRSIDAALAAMKGDPPMNTPDIFEGFDPSKYEDEARQRWGDTEAYRHSSKRTATYGPQQWAAIKAESTEILDALAVQRAQGAATSDAAVVDLAERHRMHIDRWFYPCSHEMHCGLAQMYVADARFRENLDAHGEGVAEFLAGAIECNASRRTSETGA